MADASPEVDLPMAAVDVEEGGIDDAAADSQSHAQLT